jgi:protocatechuate 3,4-dioxygenase beta subunit
LRASSILLVGAIACGVVHAAAPGRFGYEVTVNIADQRQVRRTASLAEGETQQVPLDGALRLDLYTTTSGNGNPIGWVALVDTAGSTAKPLSRMATEFKPGKNWVVTFSLCGERVIALHDRDATPGRCTDLPPMAPPDRGVGVCGDSCRGPYEDMPAHITSRARIAAASEPGAPLVIAGRVTDLDGRPRAGVIVYAYHTNAHGLYPQPQPPRSDQSDYHGTLRGWARTDAQGRYSFETIRPASYPDSDVPQHVHMHVIEPGCATYLIDELRFTDDPMYRRMTPEERRREDQGQGGSGVGTPRRRGKGSEVTRDIHLGENIADYRPCVAPK